MTHRASPRFWQLYKQLPRHVRRQADREYSLLKRDPQHPGLHFKRVGRFWSVRIGLDYRALSVEDGDIRIWMWIGTHQEYDKLLGGS